MPAEAESTTCDMTPADHSHRSTGDSLSTRSAPLRIITIDVEEYFHAEAARPAAPAEIWRILPSRVERNTDLLLSLLANLGRVATFFVLGDIAQHHPALIGRIAQAGHEIACHGYAHDRLERLSPNQFRQDVLRSKRLLEDITSQPVIGYRAPSFSITPRTAQAIDVLVELGFQYDSSIFPVRHPHYGVPDAPDRPYRVQSSGVARAHHAPRRPGMVIPCVSAMRPLLELPPLTWRVGKQNIPVAGGAYFRLFPLQLMRCGMNQAARQGRPAIFYFHPWEFDPEAPQLALPLLSRLRMRFGCGHAAKRLSRLIDQQGEWTTIANALPRLNELALRTPSVSLTASKTRSPADVSSGEYQAAS